METLSRCLSRACLGKSSSLSRACLGKSSSSLGSSYESSKCSRVLSSGERHELSAAGGSNGPAPADAEALQRLLAAYQRVVRKLQFLFSISM
jgi:hypothetical protein